MRYWPNSLRLLKRVREYNRKQFESSATEMLEHRISVQKNGKPLSPNGYSIRFIIMDINRNWTSKCHDIYRQRLLLDHINLRIARAFMI